MGFEYYKNLWTSIFKLARTYWENLDCTTNGREQQGEQMSDYNEEESDTRVGGDTYKLESQDRVSSYKL